MCEYMVAGYRRVTDTLKMLQNKNKTSEIPSIIMALTIITTIRFYIYAMKERLSFGFRDFEYVPAKCKKRTRV